MDYVYWLENDTYIVEAKNMFKIGEATPYGGPTKVIAIEKYNSNKDYARSEAENGKN